MSQPNNYPSFGGYSESYYGSEPSQPLNDASYTHWNQQGPRSMGLPASSPSPSVQTASSAPNPRHASSMGFTQAEPAMRDHHLDPRLPPGNPFLTVPQGRHSHSSTALDNANPIARFYNEDAPWSTERMRGPNVSFFPPPMDYRPYPSSVGSEIDSLPRGSDSGYRTLTSPSLLANDHERIAHDFSSEVTFQNDNITVSPVASDVPLLRRGPSSMTDQTSQYSRGSGPRSAETNREIRCPDCGDVSRCKSDHKKHMLRHNKPYVCVIPNCRRAGKGFTTQNDLDRHKKSVHRIGALDNSYQCASENCRSKEKIWPRLDNFKQHIHRMHPEEDQQDLVRRSTYLAEEPSSAVDTVSVAPMETQLAGTGTGVQFSDPSNEIDDPVPGISLTPNQATPEWSTGSSSDLPTQLSPAGVDQSKCTSTSRPKTASQLISTQDVLGLEDSCNRLDALADAASSQVLPSEVSTRHVPRLSTAPQTKSEQQKASQKFSKVIVQHIRNVSEDDQEDLEGVILRALATSITKGRLPVHESSVQPSRHNSAINQTDREDQQMDFLTKEDVLKATQALSKSIKKALSKRQYRHSTIPDKVSKCAHCPVTVARPCDMRKHMKRHTRPYGCTFPKCHKRFGAKSDWKRHENSQHFQLESFRCQLPSPSLQDPCGELFYRAETFRTHLQVEHKMDASEQLNHEVKTRRIGKNGQGQFWCGFCQSIVRLEKKRNAAWDERFDHIDNHFSREGRGIGEWLCVEAKKSKGDILKEMDRNAFDDEDGGGVSSSDGQGSPDPMPLNSPDARMQQDSPVLLVEGLPLQANISRKRASDGSLPPPKRSCTEVSWYCCACRNGPWGTHMFMSCISCNHQLCGKCEIADDMDDL